MKEFRFGNDEVSCLIVVTEYGDGMLFKYDLMNDGNCYEMKTIGSPVASQVRDWIEKYDNNK